MELFVEIQVKDFEALSHFEKKANAVMYKYGGSIKQAYELKRNADGSGTEIHIVSFSTEKGFTEYQNDPTLASLSELRGKAIQSITARPIIQVKSYV